MKKNYSEGYKSPQWQKRRLEILSRADFKCELCGCDNEQLHVHHKYYTEGKQVWEYDNKCLIALCESCHEEEHESINGLYDYIYYLRRSFAKSGFTATDLLMLFSYIDNNLDYYSTAINKGASINDLYICDVLNKVIEIHNDYKKEKQKK